MKKYFNLRSIMIAVSILLCLVGTSALGYLHLTQPTASAIEKKAKKTKEAKEQDIEKSTPETKKPRVKSPEAKQAVVDALIQVIRIAGNKINIVWRV